MAAALLLFSAMGIIADEADAEPIFAGCFTVLAARYIEPMEYAELFIVNTKNVGTGNLNYCVPAGKIEAAGSFLDAYRVRVYDGKYEAAAVTEEDSAEYKLFTENHEILPGTVIYIYSDPFAPELEGQLSVAKIVFAGMSDASEEEFVEMINAMNALGMYSQDRRIHFKHSFENGVLSTEIVELEPEEYMNALLEAPEAEKSPNTGIMLITLSAALALWAACMAKKR